MKRREEQAPPLPSSEHIILPQPETIFSLRRQAKFHTAGISLAAGGKFHSPQVNFTVQPPTAVEPYASLRDGSKEPAGTRAEKKILQRADMESAPTKKGEISHRKYITCRLRQITLAKGESHCANEKGDCACDRPLFCYTKTNAVAVFSCRVGYIVRAGQARTEGRRPDYVNYASSSRRRKSMSDRLPQSPGC